MPEKKHRTMDESALPTPAEESPSVPLPRDPPAPPGYVDPLEGVGALDDLVPDAPEGDTEPA